MKSVLAIAGTDPSGGAGIQADTKTITVHKVFATNVITSLVAQNTTGVFDILDIPIEFIKAQLKAVFDDIYPDAVKIGMVSSVDIINTLAETLKEYKAAHIVLDPVMVSTSGSKLLKDDAITALKEKLFPLAEIITPNIREAQVLCGYKIKSKEKMVQAAEDISRFFSGWVLLKGGHSEENADDLLYRQGEIVWLEGAKINNPNTHGTGCTLSSAIASNLALGDSVPQAVKKAKEYVTGAIAQQLNLGKGRGPLHHSYVVHKDC